MYLDADTMNYIKIFEPDLLKSQLTALETGIEFAYYTTSETAQKVIENEEIWLRNSSLMNDFSEIKYGIGLIAETFLSDHGTTFRDAVAAIDADIVEEVLNLLRAWEHSWKYETYIACVSEHLPEEDCRGRLSMWRAYGNIAFIINNAPMNAITDALGVYSSPVRYWSAQDYWRHIEEVTKNIISGTDALSKLTKKQIIAYLYQKFMLIALCTKHPGFSEEREWRIFTNSSTANMNVLNERIVVIGGVPQKILALPLKEDPENGLIGANLSSLLQKLIVGPTNHPEVSRAAFTSLLARSGVKDAASKVIVTDIPLRT